MVLRIDLAASSSEAVPMEVDRVTGKGVKGKTKGKDGKGGKKGDGKNQPQWFDYKGGKGKGKGNNNAWSSGGKGSGSWTSTEKGKGKNKGKGKTDGKNKGAKGKGKCWTCGGNHYERDCWYKNGSVQQVTDESVASGSNQAPAAASSGSGSSSSNQQQNTRRVHHEGLRNHSVMHTTYKKKRLRLSI